MAPVNSFDRSCKGFNAFESCWAVAELPFYDGSLSAINLLFLDHPKSLDLIFIYPYGLIISIGNPRLFNYASIED